MGRQEAKAHAAIMIGADETPDVTAAKDSDLVVFLVNRAAKFRREGTTSG